MDSLWSFCDCCVVDYNGANRCTDVGKICVLSKSFATDSNWTIVSIHCRRNKSCQLDVFEWLGLFLCVGGGRKTTNHHSKRIGIVFGKGWWARICTPSRISLHRG